MRFGRIGRLTGVLGMTGILVAGTYAFTNANTVPGSKAGDGSGSVTGYVLSSVHYNLNATSPQNVDSVTFTLDSTPVSGGAIKAQMDPAGSWYSCTNSGANVTCTTTSPQATVVGATSLRVVIAQ
jgi:predicted outer membrane repeat protein